jgi:hypothetical protein
MLSGQDDTRCNRIVKSGVMMGGKRKHAVLEGVVIQQ